MSTNYKKRDHVLFEKGTTVDFFAGKMHIKHIFPPSTGVHSLSVEDAMLYTE